jgi:hypothetical protein
MHTQFQLENLQGTDHWGDSSVNGKTRKYILKKYSVRVEAGFVWLICEQSSEPSGSLTGRKDLNGV